MRFQAGIQVILLLTAAVIVFTVIKPKFAMIRQTQVEAVAYQNAVDNIGQYNQRLQQLVSEANTISPTNLEALYRYLPEEVDAVAVGRDIHNIADNNNMTLFDVIPQDPETLATEMGASDSMNDPDQSLLDENGLPINTFARGRSYVLVTHPFEVKVVGLYDDLKAMLRDLERNNYPLRIVELSFAVDETDEALTEYSLTLETYSLAAN